MSKNACEGMSAWSQSGNERMSEGIIEGMNKKQARIKKRKKYR